MSVGRSIQTILAGKMPTTLNKTSLKLFLQLKLCFCRQIDFSIFFQCQWLAKNFHVVLCEMGFTFVNTRGNRLPLALIFPIHMHITDNCRINPKRKWNLLLFQYRLQCSYHIVEFESLSELHLDVADSLHINFPYCNWLL